MPQLQAHSEPKTCARERCGRTFHRRYGVALSEWARRRFCSGACYNAERKERAAPRPRSHSSAEQQRRWRAANPEKVKAYTRDKAWRSAYMQEWNRKNRQKLSVKERRRRLQRYGLTPEQYDQMFQQQEGRCAICRRHVSELSTRHAKHPDRLDVDHCHRSGRVRALLCFNCNAILGNANDSVATLRRAIEYLESFE